MIWVERNKILFDCDFCLCENLPLLANEHPVQQLLLQVGGPLYDVFGWGGVHAENDALQILG